MAAGDVPPYHELLLPALQAVGELGGSASISEIVETVIKREGFSDAQQAVLHNDGPETEIGYRLAWARTYLKGMGLLTSSSRGVWALTDDGTGLLTDPSATDAQRSERIQELRARYLIEMRTARKARLPQDDGELDDVQIATERSWKEQLLEQLMSMPPDAFERLARRLLREADFDSVNVTGKSGDGGIDGLGRLPARARELSGLLSVQALPRQCQPQRRPRLPRCDGRPRRQRSADHDGHVHGGCQEGSNS